MMKKSKSLTALILVLLLLLLSGCGKTGVTDKIPTEVTDFLTDYLEAEKKGTQFSVDFVYFLPENSDRYDAFRNSGNRVIEYTIHEGRTVNADLYAFLITYDDLTSAEGYFPPTTTWTYVARVDGVWRIITSARNIPEEIKDGYDATTFTIPEGYETIPPENYVDPADVLIN